MSITPYPVSAPFLARLRPVSGIAPFTYRDGMTYLRILEELIRYVNQTLGADLNEQLNDIVTQLNTTVEQMEAEIVQNEAEYQQMLDAFTETIWNIVNDINDRAGAVPIQRYVITDDFVLNIDETWPHGQPVVIQLVQDNVGGHTVTFGEHILNPAGIVVDETANAVTEFVLMPQPGVGYATEYRWTGLAGNSTSQLLIDNVVTRTNLCVNPQAQNNVNDYARGPASASTHPIAASDGGSTFARVVAIGTLANAGIYTPSFAVTPNQPASQYSGRLRFRAPAGVNVQLAIRLFNASDATVTTLPFTAFAANGQWQRHTWTLDARSGINAAVVKARVFAYIPDVAPSGATLDITDVLYENAVAVGDYFDGNARDIPGDSVDWVIESWQYEFDQLTTETAEAIENIATDVADVTARMPVAFAGNNVLKYWGASQTPYNVVTIYNNEAGTLGDYIVKEFGSDPSLGPSALLPLETFAGRTGGNVIVNASGWDPDGGLTGPQYRNGVFYHGWGSTHPTSGAPRGRECFALLNDGTFKAYSEILGDTLTDMVDDGVRHSWSFGPIVVRDGAVRDIESDPGLWGSFATERTARTLIGWTVNNDVKIISIPGHPSSIYGVVGNQLGALAVAEGCVCAVMMDGGGSTQLFTDGGYSVASYDGGAKRPVVDVFGVRAALAYPTSAPWLPLELLPNVSVQGTEIPSVKFENGEFRFKGQLNYTGGFPLGATTALAQVPRSLPTNVAMRIVMCGANATKASVRVLFNTTGLISASMGTAADVTGGWWSLPVFIDLSCLNGTAP